MAEQERRKAGAAPISRHPLFPAIVALWCGALFGLSSVVIGPAFIERAVVSTGIDRVVPMAAPPLGTTTRILFALTMTCIGALIGALVTRRIARPAPALESSRRAVAQTDDHAEAVDDVAVEAAPALGDVKAEPKAEVGAVVTPGRIPGRRRALALDSQVDTSAHDERAPMPGRDPQPLAPRILDVAEFDVDRFDEIEQPVNAFRAPSAPENDEVEELTAIPAWLGTESAWHEAVEDVAEEPADYDDRPHASSAPAGAQVFQQVLQAQIDEQAAAPRPSFTARFVAVPQGEDENEADKGFSLPPIGNRLFETYSREISARTEEAARVEPGFKLLPRLQSTPWGQDDMPEVPAYTPARQPDTAVHFDVPESNSHEPLPNGSSANEGPGTAADQQPTVERPGAAMAEDLASASTLRSETAGARRIAEANLADLSPVELLERLALAMAARREKARLAAATDAGADVPPIAVEFTPLREVTALETALPQDDLAAFENLAPASLTAPAPFLAPVVESSPEADDAIKTPVVPRAEIKATIPAALRPVGFDDDDIDDALPSYIPPRHIGLAAVDGVSEQDGSDHSRMSFAPASFPLSPFAAEDAAAEHDTVLQHGYSSLLDLSRRSQAQRRLAPIEDFEDSYRDGDIAPDLASEAAGEAPPFAGRPALAAAPAVDEPTLQSEPAEEARFDGPGDADPDATDRALRAALATLQRMSGAA